MDRWVLNTLEWLSLSSVVLSFCRADTLFPVLLFLSFLSFPRTTDVRSVLPVSMQAPSPLPQIQINSCTQIPLKILSPGCHLFSRGLDQIRPRAACREGAPLFQCTALKTQHYNHSTLLCMLVLALLTRIEKNNTKKTSTKRAVLTLVPEVKYLYCKKKNTYTPTAFHSASRGVYSIQ